ncbi:uncharacterized protein CANTADRAFT_26048 [Suhomyces tanzawaensis NRRL Y-17324]|uniref:Uncharacterized protein n=1 Tax=Suhomyces tanzawaensis NRRL Y-17324 TaxID=984487 RepID=A0A1E4SHH2_9ASCO|nr:uncharacterized protein CANTADRAFT_26048 [Suhomyces tanzawaensis NRRL Y-17324]ODV78937.1 hypothetical protein CANTADRAFT_26048 [Suhomyces tanzawaensis NRRL Y-17324]
MLPGMVLNSQIITDFVSCRIKWYVVWGPVNSSTTSEDTVAVDRSNTLCSRNELY